MLKFCVVLVVLGLACTAFGNMGGGSGVPDTTDAPGCLLGGVNVAFEVGETKTVYCVEYRCNPGTNGPPQLERLTELKCSLKVNSVENCLNNGEVLQCIKCNIDTSQTQPITFTTVPDCP